MNDTPTATTAELGKDDHDRGSRHRHRGDRPHRTDDQAHGEHFLQRVYTEEEIRYCQRRKESYQHFAGRWAAKEAVMKTFGTGWTKGVGWLDIEVATRRSGQPMINIHGTARDLAGQFGIDEVLISISHCRAYATATAIAIRHGEAGEVNGEAK